MFGVSFSELLIIAAAALLVLGPAKLPDLLRTVGRAMRELRRASQELRSQLDIDGALRSVTFDGPEPAERPTRATLPSRIYPPEGVDAEDVHEETFEYPPDDLGPRSGPEQSR